MVLLEVFEKYLAEFIFTRATDVYSADIVSIKQGFYCTTLFTKFFVNMNKI